MNRLQRILVAVVAFVLILGITVGSINLATAPDCFEDEVAVRVVTTGSYECVATDELTKGIRP